MNPDCSENTVDISKNRLELIKINRELKKKTFNEYDTQTNKLY